MGVKKGAPDLIVYTGKQWQWWELKTDKGKQSIEQVCFMNVAKEFGIPYYIIRSIDDAKKAVGETHEKNMEQLEVGHK